MFEHLRLPRWIGWFAFVGASFYFLAKLVFLILWSSDQEAYSHLEPVIGLLDVGFGILWTLAVLILGQSGELQRIARMLESRIRRHITDEHEKTRRAISNPRSAQHGFSLLKNAKWGYNTRNGAFYCVDDLNWTIVQKEEPYRKFKESWLESIHRPDPTVKVFRTTLKHNNVEIKSIIFLDLDGSRLTMPIPRRDPDFYYCEGSVEHLMFNIVRQAMSLTMEDIELRDLARKGKIEWRRCDADELFI